MTVRISEHPLVAHKLGLLRAEATESPLFRALLRELTFLLLYESLSDLRLSTGQIKTPIAETAAGRLADRIGFVPILRAGLGMVDAALELVPTADVRHLGLYRDHDTLRPVHYYSRLEAPPTADVYVVLDPMLATGQSAVAAIQILRAWGVNRIKFVGIIGAPAGVAALTVADPAVDVYLAALDPTLDHRGYIIPGLGDAGDRQFRT